MILYIALSLSAFLSILLVFTIVMALAYSSKKAEELYNKLEKDKYIKKVGEETNATSL